METKISRAELFDDVQTKLVKLKRSSQQSVTLNLSSDVGQSK